MLPLSASQLGIQCVLSPFFTGQSVSIRSQPFLHADVNVLRPPTASPRTNVSGASSNTQDKREKHMTSWCLTYGVEAYLRVPYIYCRQQSEPGQSANHMLVGNCQRGKGGRQGLHGMCAACREVSGKTASKHRERGTNGSHCGIPNNVPSAAARTWKRLELIHS